MTAWWTLMLRDLRLAWRSGGAAGLSLGFFVMATSLYPFGLGPDPVTLASVAAGLIWVTAMFAALLSLDRLFQADFEDGTLTQLLLSKLTAPGIVFAKITAHWLGVMLPLIIVSPLLALILGLPGSAIGPLMLSLVVGTPALSCLGAVVAALTVAVRRGGALMTILLIPLFVPSLIFGAASVEAGLVGTDPSGALLLAAAVSLFALALAPVAASAALRLAAE